MRRFSVAPILDKLLPVFGKPNLVKSRSFAYSYLNTLDLKGGNDG